MEQRAPEKWSALPTTKVKWGFTWAPVIFPRESKSQLSDSWINLSFSNSNEMASMRSSTYRSMSKSQKIHLNATNHNKSKQGYYLKKGVKHIHASSKTGLNKFNSHRGYGLDKQNKFKSSSNLAHTLTQAPGLGSNRVFQSDKFRSSNRSNSPRLNLSSIKNPIKIKIKKHSDIQKPNIKSKPVSIDE